MNNWANKTDSVLPKRKRFLEGKRKDVVIIVVLGIVLLFAVWRIFYTNGESTETGDFGGLSENEKRISRLLAQIDGVGEAEVAICQTEEGVQSVVVVCEGANDLQVVLNVREAVAAALGTTQNAVKIYLKKE